MPVSAEARVIVTQLYSAQSLQEACGLVHTGQLGLEGKTTAEPRQLSLLISTATQEAGLLQSWGQGFPPRQGGELGEVEWGLGRRAEQEGSRQLKGQPLTPPSFLMESEMPSDYKRGQERGEKVKRKGRRKGRGGRGGSGLGLRYGAAPCRAWLGSLPA